MVDAITKRFINFLDSGSLFDVILLVGTNQVQVKAHKQILMLSSSYFYSKFVGSNNNGLSGSKSSADNPVDELISLFEEVKELNIKIPEEKSSKRNSSGNSNGNCNGSVLRIEDLEEKEVRLFLKYLYSREFSESFDDALPLFKAAIKFEDPDLLKHCRNIIVKNMSSDNALTIFELALELNDDQLTDNSLEIISRNAYNILEQQMFTELNGNSLFMILEKNELQANDEMQLFQALIRWGKQECNRQNLNPAKPTELRSVLEPYINLIRFPQMSPSEFSIHVATQNVLTSDELVSILLYFNVPESQRSIMPTGRFNSNPRSYKKQVGSQSQQVPYTHSTPTPVQFKSQAVGPLMLPIRPPSVMKSNSVNKVVVKTANHVLSKHLNQNSVDKCRICNAIVSQGESEEVARSFMRNHMQSMHGCSS